MKQSLPPSSPWEMHPKGIVLRIRLTPNAARTQIGDIIHYPQNGQDLLAWQNIQITDIPEKGKANKALLKYLSKLSGIAKSDLSLIQGQKDRFKRVLFLNLKSAPTLSQSK